MKKIASILVLLGMFLFLSSCNLPVPGQAGTPLPEENLLPAVSVGPLPPALVETAPLPGSQLPVDGEISFFFNQPMERASVEAAIQGSPALNGSFHWVDESQVIFQPAALWPADTALEITVASSAQSQDGMVMEEPQTRSFRTADYLRLVQALPETAAQEVDPESAIVASFNQPVVPLGADQTGLPVGFALTPSAQGRGEWLNTSTYIFYPEPALTGGQEYNVALNPELVSTDQTPLDAVTSWQFVTLTPGFSTYSPSMNVLHVRLDEPVRVTFNQAMDPVSVEAAFTLRDEDQNAVPGSFEWAEDLTTFTYTPNALYQRGMRYTFSVPEGVLSRGGTPLLGGLKGGFYAAMDLFVLDHSPENGGLKSVYAPVEITFNAPVESDNLKNFISVSPNLKLQISGHEDSVWVYANFEAEETYTITVRSGLIDIWGSALANDYVFSFKGEPLSASFLPSAWHGNGVLFVNPDQPLISAQAVNIDQITVLTSPVNLDEFLYFSNQASYEEQIQYQPVGIRSHTQTLTLAPNRSQVAGVALNGGEELSPGLYWVLMQPDPAPQFSSDRPVYAVVSHVQLVFKVSAVDALVWAIDTRTGAPVKDTPVQIVNSDGQVLANGTTDGAGLFTSTLAERESFGSTVYAIVGEPGSEFYSLARSDWSQGVSGWDFGYSNSITPPETAYYVYTDRPIYRPGQQVNFRVVARQAFNGRYFPPSSDQVTVTVRDGIGDEIETITLPLSEFGTANGAYSLPEGALPGYYELQPGDGRYADTVTFQVAEYRKPEIDLSMNFASLDVLGGDQLDGEISTRYYFDAPAAGSEISWHVYARNGYFSLPGYQVGPANYYSRSFHGEDPLGAYLTGGTGTAGDDGRLAVSFPAEDVDQTTIYTLETTVQDASGLLVSNRTTTTVHPERVYIGLKSDLWVGQAGTQMGFDIKVVDWDRHSAGVQNLTETFGRVTWEQGAKDLYGLKTYEKKVEILSRESFQSDSNGLSRLAFTPDEPGVYQLTVESGNARTELILWVGGAGTAIWPSQEDKQLELLVDKDSYQPGEVATVFVPNPFSGEALALVTFERGEIMENQIYTLEEAGMSIPVQLTEEAAPNIYFTVAVLGDRTDGRLGFRYGVVNLPVAADELLLNVEVLGQPERTQPGEPVELTIRVTDASGKPVQGEFSLAVVDEAVLALADRFEDPIGEAFYGRQGLGVLTGISLVADAELYFELPGGLGGGGGDQSVSQMRSEFQDTAYWNAVVVTGADGTASLKVTLPDNLTTWQVLARGLSKDTLVGEGLSEVITTKPLLIRPVTPRFLVVGDQVELAAVVHNNTDQPIEATVALTADGFELNDAAQARQAVTVAAGGQVRVNWRGTVLPADSFEPVFAVEGGGLQDASTPTAGPIPVVGFLAPQAFLTSGVLDAGGEKLELVSLPRSFDPSGGSLRLELASSLASVALDGLDVVENYDNGSTEYTVSSFLPTIEMMLAIQEFGLDDSALRTRLDARLRGQLVELQDQQNYDGGWSWHPGIFGASSPTLSAYVLMGLAQAQGAGYTVNEYVLENAINYLRGYLSANPPESDKPWEYDRDVLLYYALMKAGFPMFGTASANEEHWQEMSPWAQALFGILMAEGKRSDISETIFSDLQSTAIRSATGAHWASRGGHWPMLSSDTVNNAIVIYALAQRDPASPLVTDAVRYLMSHRDAQGGWQSSYATAWSLLAVTEVMRGTGELGGEFAFSASLNGNPFAAGEAGGAQQFTQVVAETGLGSLLTDLPNALVIQRDPGQGRLYYRAQLHVLQPVTTVTGLNRGVGVSRAYYPADVDCTEADCDPVQTARVGELLRVRVTLNVPAPVHYLQVEDYIPAGTEVLNLSLKTSQAGEAEETVVYQSKDPYASGWGWWYFGGSQVYDDHITWTAESLPAGTYELTYTLVALQPGVFQARPAQAWQIYFPEVQGISAGSLLEILP